MVSQWPAVIRSRVLDYVSLMKPGITVFVALSSAAGFILGSSEIGLDPFLLCDVALATVAVAAGAIVLNQYVERDLDAKMARTANRPIPSGRLDPAEAYGIGVLLSALGVTYFLVRLNWLAGLLAALAWGIYLFLYTPLKRKSSLHTTLGAVAGALPPVGGWAAARGEFAPEAWVLFLIAFFWQYPHFLTIAWIHREDLPRESYCWPAVQDADGPRLPRQVVLWTLALLAGSLLPVALGMSGYVYLVVAFLLGSCLLALGLSFTRQRTQANARRLLWASLFYLPLLWTAMVLGEVTL
jgi:protoheme IX farnesyltransferase